MANTSNFIPRSNPTVEGLPGAFCPRGDADFYFFVKATPDEARLFQEALYPSMSEGVSVLFRYVTAAWLGDLDGFGNLTIEASNDEFRAREVAEALNEVLTRINAKG